MQPRIITLCYITILMSRAAYLFPLGLLHTHTHTHSVTDAGRLRLAEATLSSDKEWKLWRHIPALILLPKLLCNTYKLKLQNKN